MFSSLLFLFIISNDIQPIRSDKRISLFRLKFSELTIIPITIDNKILIKMILQYAFSYKSLFSPPF